VGKNEKLNGKLTLSKSGKYYFEIAGRKFLVVKNSELKKAQGRPPAPAPEASPLPVAEPDFKEVPEYVSEKGKKSFPPPGSTEPFVADIPVLKKIRTQAENFEQRKKALKDEYMNDSVGRVDFNDDVLRYLLGNENLGIEDAMIFAKESGYNVNDLRTALVRKKWILFGKNIVKIGEKDVDQVELQRRFEEVKKEFNQKIESQARIINPEETDIRRAKIVF